MRAHPCAFDAHQAEPEARLMIQSNLIYERHRRDWPGPELTSPRSAAASG